MLLNVSASTKCWFDYAPISFWQSVFKLATLFTSSCSSDDVDPPQSGHTYAFSVGESADAEVVLEATCCDSSQHHRRGIATFIARPLESLDMNGKSLRFLTRSGSSYFNPF